MFGTIKRLLARRRAAATAQRLGRSLLEPNYVEAGDLPRGLPPRITIPEKLSLEDRAKATAGEYERMHSVGDAFFGQNASLNPALIERMKHRSQELDTRRIAETLQVIDGITVNESLTQEEIDAFYASLPRDEPSHD